MLKFSPANAKTKRLKTLPELQCFLDNKRKVYSLDLLSGWSCPGAKDCLARVHVEDGRRWLEDGSQAQFRCFSASQEVAFPNVYKLRKHNFDSLKKCKGAVQCKELILKSLPKNIGILRYHVGGEFFSRVYLHGAIAVALARPDVLFYTYTKSLHFLQNLDMVDRKNGMILPNFLVTTSRGGKYDHLIPKVGIRTAKVVLKMEDAGTLPIDHDDSHAARPGGDFALLIHGQQKAGSEASLARKKLGKLGSYGK